jgi:hypothetical protein
MDGQLVGLLSEAAARKAVEAVPPAGVGSVWLADSMSDSSATGPKSPSGRLVTINVRLLSEVTRRNELEDGATVGRRVTFDRTV